MNMKSTCTKYGRLHLHVQTHDISCRLMYITCTKNVTFSCTYTCTDMNINMYVYMHMLTYITYIYILNTNMNLNM